MNYEAKEVAKFVVNYANSKGKFVNNTMVNIILYYLFLRIIKSNYLVKVIDVFTCVCMHVFTELSE